MKTMKATVFHGANDVRVEEVERPHAGPGEAVIRVTLTTFAAPISTSCAENIR
jgi:threonine dehydrogenase-like Zn-dependent dehydrogenase